MSLNDPSVLLKIGGKKLKEDYSNNQVRFGCAANWIMYFHKNLGTDKYFAVEDPFECAFAKLKKDSADVQKLSRQYGNNLLFTGQNDYYYIQTIPSILTPMLCFYGIDALELFDGIDQDNQSIQQALCREFNLKKYARVMDYKDTSSTVCLLIKDTAFFIRELSSSVYKYLSSENCTLTQKRFIDDLPALPNFFHGWVDYSLDFNKEFKLSAYFYNQIRYKNPRYKYQSEYRFAITYKNFEQDFNPECYDYTLNELTISLPNLHKYAEIIELSTHEKIMFTFYRNKGFNFSIQ